MKLLSGLCTQAELLEDVGLTSEAIESKVAERIAKLGI